MSKNEIILFSVYDEFKAMKNENDFVIDKSGSKMLELINKCLVLDPTEPYLDLGFKKSNIPYIEKELDWYLSESLNIHPMMSDIKIWNQVADKDGFINSNYGWCIFSDKNYNQFDFAVKELISNVNSRRACMMYNRPSMTIDFNKNGMSDYMCTIYAQVFIRHDELIYNVHQRSCDIVFGFQNDFAWHCFVYGKLMNSLASTYPNLKYGKINYNFDSLHLYERHFSYLD